MISAALGMLMAIMFGSLIAMKITSAGDRDKPRPSPHMLAPAPAPGDRVSFALIDSHYVGEGW